MKKTFNFSAGPSMLPVEVLLKAKKELLNWNKLGISIMEISHRSKEFINLTEQIDENIRTLLQIPNTYKVLFCHGGGRGQFAAIPLNLLKKHQSADYIDSGYWSKSAIQEAKKYCYPNIINVQITVNKTIKIIPMKHWKLNINSKYIHYCPNETIDGIAIEEEPIFNKPVIADLSSSILSKPININHYDLIYASAQKNIGPSGITLVIIKKNLLGYARKELPSILNYQLLAKNNSMFNTPSTFSWYLSGLVFQWLKKEGGLEKISLVNKMKSDLLYSTIDKSDFYCNNVFTDNRSKMNIPFKLIDCNLDEFFLKESFKEGFFGLKGHKVLGGMRASIYNAMPLEGVKELTKFMGFFEKKYG